MFGCDFSSGVLPAKERRLALRCRQSSCCDRGVDNRTTEALYYSNWTIKTGITPNTKNWRGWLREAKESITNRDWHPIAAKDRWMDTTFATPGIDENAK